MSRVTELLLIGRQWDKSLLLNRLYESTGPQTAHRRIGFSCCFYVVRYTKHFTELPTLIFERFQHSEIPNAIFHVLLILIVRTSTVQSPIL